MIYITNGIEVAQRVQGVCLNLEENVSLGSSRWKALVKWV